MKLSDISETLDSLSYCRNPNSSQLNDFFEKSCFLDERKFEAFENFFNKHPPSPISASGSQVDVKLKSFPFHSLTHLFLSRFAAGQMKKKKRKVFKSKQMLWKSIKMKYLKSIAMINL